MLQTYFKKDGMHNFFVVSTTGEVNTGYQSQLFRYHAVPYFLQYEERCLNGEQALYYSVKSRTSIKSVKGHLPFTFQRVKNMVDSIIGVLETAEEYLLKADHILWKTDAVFIEAESGMLQFCYCPAEEDHGSLTTFLSELIQAIDKKQEEAVLFMLKFYNQITEPDCTLEKLQMFRSGSLREEYDSGKKAEGYSDIRRNANEKVISGTRSDNLAEREKTNYSMKKGDAGLKSEKDIDEKNSTWSKKPDWETEKPKSIGEQVVKIALIAAAVVNAVLIVCLFSNILTYDNVYYLFFGLGAMIVLSLVYMQLTKEESPDAIMQEYFDLQRQREHQQRSKTGEEEKMSKAANVLAKDDILRVETQSETGMIAPFLNERNRDSDSGIQKEVFGETRLLIAQPANKEEIVMEQEEIHLCLEAMEKDQYPSIHVQKNSVVLGSMAESCNYVLRAKGVSRMHAKIMEKDDGVYLLDLNSTNGTYLNGEMIESGKDYKLEEGDMVTFALSEFYVARESVV